jgi:hypothetical protein
MSVERAQIYGTELTASRAREAFSHGLR